MNITISDAIITALISATAMIVVQSIKSFSSKNKIKKTEQNELINNQQIKYIVDLFNERFDHIDERIDKLEEKVNTHNHYSEKFGTIKENIKNTSKEITEIKSDIKDLRKEFSHVVCKVK